MIDREPVKVGDAVIYHGQPATIYKIQGKEIVLQYEDGFLIDILAVELI